MSEKRLRREAFLRQHPMCCFCGGASPSAEIDHFPSRALFDERQWPVGYEFPACARCNDVTRRDELIVALLSRVQPDTTGPVIRAELQELLRSIKHNFPGLLDAMKPTHRQLRNAQLKYGLVPPQRGASTDIPIVSLIDPRIQDAVGNFGRKLGLALYYKHTGRILPPSGGVGLRWYSNLQIENDQIPRELSQVLPEFPRLERSNRNLANQFFYRVGVAEGSNMATYLAIFRRSFGIVGFMHVKATELEAPAHIMVRGPYPAGAQGRQEGKPP